MKPTGYPFPRFPYPVATKIVAGILIIIVLLGLFYPNAAPFGLRREWVDMGVMVVGLAASLYVMVLSRRQGCRKAFGIFRVTSIILGAFIAAYGVLLAAL